MSVTFKFRFIKFVSKLWSKHNLTKYVVLKTLNQQAPPCYLLHLNSYDLAAWNVIPVVSVLDIIFSDW
jgi:hypothetical protein